MDFLPQAKMLQIQTLRKNNNLSKMCVLLKYAEPRMQCSSNSQQLDTPSGLCEDFIIHGVLFT